MALGRALPLLLLATLLAASCAAVPVAGPPVRVEVEPPPGDGPLTALAAVAAAREPGRFGLQAVVQGELPCTMLVAAVGRTGPAGSATEAAFVVRGRPGAAVLTGATSRAVLQADFPPPGLGPQRALAFTFLASGAGIHALGPTGPGLGSCQDGAATVVAFRADGPQQVLDLRGPEQVRVHLDLPDLPGVDPAWLRDHLFVRVAALAADGPPGAPGERAAPAILVPAGSRHDPADADGTLGAAAWSGANLTFAAGAAAAAGAAGAAAWQSHRWRDWHLPLPLPLLALFTRLQRPRLLEHPTRRRIHDLVESRPGIRFAELRAASGLPTGVLTHHLRMLEAHGLLHTVRRGRQRHLFTRAPERPGAGLPDAAGRILQLLRQGVRTQREIAERAQLSQQAVSYHLRRLRALGVVRRDAGSAHGSYVAAAPA